MKKALKLSPLALLIASPLALAGAQQESNGFIEDSSFSITNRLSYYNSDPRNGGETDGGHGHIEETAYGLVTSFESGFTQGTVGFGIDAHTLTTVKIDTGRGRYGEDMVAAGSDGVPEDTQTEFGGAIKARISDTVLKHGNMQIDTPVLSTDDTIVPEIATGTLLTSEDIGDVSIVAGRFTGLSSMIQTTRDDRGLTHADIFGIEGELVEGLGAALYTSKVEDYFRKVYVNFNYGVELSDSQALEFDFNGYRTKDTGEALEGEVDNRIWSLSAAWSFDAHTLTLAYQRSSGDTSYTYGIDGDGAIYLANSVAYSDFMGADERSWQVRYDIDMESYGVPGLAIGTSYTTGDNIDLGGGQEAKEHEFDIEAEYTVQAGFAKDLTVVAEYALYRASDDYEDDANEIRVTFEYPLDIL